MSEKYRDTSGPSKDDILRLLDAAGKHQNGAKATRDVALIMVLFGAGLRRGEVAKLNLADLDQSKGKLTIIGKGRREPETITLAPRTLRTLKAWY